MNQSSCERYYADDPGDALEAVGADALDPDAVAVIQRLRKAGHRAYLVGGCVRDHLLGHIPKDYDVATSARPRQIKKVCRNSRIIGRRFRLVHVHFRGSNIIEVSTFRQDPREGSSESGSEDASDDAPDDTPDEDLLITHDNVFGTEEEDAQRRDFTINGLFLDDEGVIYDYVGGVEDLRQRVLRTIGEPVRRIREDPVRILRAIKFVTRHDLTLEPGLAAAMAEYHADLKRSAAPRVSEELLRMMGGPSPDRAFELLAHYGILDVLLPELEIHPHTDPSADRRLELLSRRLGVLGSIDRGRRSLSTAVYLCLLLYDVAWDRFDTELERGNPNPNNALDDLIRPFAARCRLSRRDTARMRSIFQALRRIDPAWSSGLRKRRRRTPVRDLISREYFRDTLMVFRVVSEAEERDADLVAQWEERARLAREENPESGSSESQEARPRKRRRRRRRREPARSEDS